MVADESDSRLNQELYSSQCDSEANPLCLTTMECVSPEPAVFGEHGMERLIPLQQEAVKPSLIHSKVALAMLLAPQSQNDRTTMMTSLDCSNRSVPLSMQETSWERQQTEVC